MSSHLTEQQLAAFRGGTMSGADVLALDTHLSACAACRASAQAFAGAAAAGIARALAVEPDAELHLDDEQLANVADGRSAPGDVARHIAQCPECAETVADLRMLRAAIVGKPNRSTVRWAVAAAAILVIGLSLRMWNRPGPAASPATDRFSAAERAAIKTALDTGALPPVHNLNSVRGHSGRLMGSSSNAQTFAVLSPVATAVDTPQPLFRWTPLDGARDYLVTIVDEALQPVAQSPPLTVTEWRPATAFAWGRTYIWQVRAILPNGSRTTPAPPEPEAKFFVLSEREAADVSSLRQRAGNSRLVGILLAEHGLMDDADAELVKAAAESPSNAALQKLEAAVKQARTTGTDPR